MLTTPTTPFVLTKLPYDFGIPVVVKNTFLDIADLATDNEPSSSTRRSSSVPKDCKFVAESPPCVDDLTNQSSEASTADPDEYGCSSDHEVSDLTPTSGPKRLQDGVQRDSVCSASLQLVSCHKEHSLGDHTASRHVSALKLPWTDRKLPSRKIRASPNNWQHITNRINALDLHTPLNQRKTRTSEAKAMQEKHFADDSSKLGGQSTRGGSISDCCTVEASEAPVDDAFEVASQTEKPAANVASLLTNETAVPSAGTTLNIKAPSFTPVGRSLGEAGMLVMAAQAALRQCPQTLAVDLTKGAVGSITTLAARMQDGPVPMGLAAHKTMDAAKAALLACAALSQTVYVVGYLTQTPFTPFDTGMGFYAALALVKRTDEHTMCWDQIQHGYCPNRATCCLCHPCDADLVHLHITCQACR